ncbi:hypothetical protein [Clostridium sp.]|uniref:hypothetical protein n=1 Tax=Clostridium sp. TaxID=1506 RepID=UPI001B52478F|nr:hypothetical protein [Clostridium sp.]MBP3916201.1 hypothetical protein [Clostridium sp.]
MFIKLKPNYNPSDILRRLNFAFTKSLVDYDFIDGEILYLEITEKMGRKLFDDYINDEVPYEEFIGKYSFNNNLEVVTLLNKLEIKDWYFDVDRKGIFQGKGELMEHKNYPMNLKIS